MEIELLPYPNPLLNSEIVEMVFNYLELDDLYECRYICKLWDEEACRQVRRNQIFYLNEKDIPLQNLLLQSRASLNISTPFLRFSFNLGRGNDDIVRTNNPNSYEIDILMNQCANAGYPAVVVELMTDSNQQALSVEFPRIMSCPSELRVLRLRKTPGYFFTQQSSQGLPLPALQVLSLGDEDLQPDAREYFYNLIKRTGNSLQDIFIRDSKLFFMISELGKLDNIVSYSAEVLTRGLANVLMSRKLKIKNLDICQLDKDCTPAVMTCLLSHLCETLEYLDVDQINMKGNALVLPRLPKLNYLDIWNWTGRVCFLTPELVPKLKILVLIHTHPSMWIPRGELVSPIVTNPSVTEIHLSGIWFRHPFFNVHHISTMLHCLMLVFPNWRILNFKHGVSNEYFFGFSIYLNEIMEELIFEWTRYITDFAFTGIPIEKREEALLMLNDNPLLKVFPGYIQTNPSIKIHTKLRKLHFEYLKFQYSNDPISHNITNFAISNGIVKVRTITDLALCWIPYLQLKPIAEEMPQLKKLILTGDKCLCPSDLKYLVYKLPDLNLSMEPCPCYLDFDIKFHYDHEMEGFLSSRTPDSPDFIQFVRDASREHVTHISRYHKFHHCRRCVSSQLISKVCLDSKHRNSGSS